MHSEHKIKLEEAKSSKYDPVSKYKSPFYVGNGIPVKLDNEFQTFDIEYRKKKTGYPYNNNNSRAVVISQTESESSRIIQLPDGRKVLQIKSALSPTGYIQANGYQYVGFQTEGRDKFCEAEELWATLPEQLSEGTITSDNEEYEDLGMVDVGNEEEEKAIGAQTDGIWSASPFEGTNVGKVAWYSKINNDTVKDIIIKMIKATFTCVNCGAKDCGTYDSLGKWECDMTQVAYTYYNEPVMYRIRADHRDVGEEAWDTNDNVVFGYETFQYFPKENGPLKEAVYQPYKEEKGYHSKSGYYEGNKSSVVRANVVIYHYDIKTHEHVQKLAKNSFSQQDFVAKLKLDFETEAPTGGVWLKAPDNLLVIPNSAVNIGRNLPDHIKKRLKRKVHEP